MAKTRQYSFGLQPSVRYRRSKFTGLSHSHKTTANVGTLYPFLCEEIYPGDTFKVKTTFVSQVTSAFLKPVMDNVFIDMYYFFVPNRLVFKDWENVLGGAQPNDWTAPEDVSVPVMRGGPVGSKTIADFFGLPVGDVPRGINVLPFRGLALIYDRWFRSQNVVDGMLVQTGAIGNNEVFNEGPWTSSNYTGLPPKVSKMHDYFTSCLPGTQKGAPISVGLSGKAPLVTGDVYGLGGDMVLTNSGMPRPIGGYTVHNLVGVSTIGTDRNLRLLPPTSEDGLPSGSMTVNQSNLYANLNDASAITVNELRYAFQTQRILEKLGLYGGRYNEYLLANFGVSAGDSRLQIPEYLGGHRVPLKIQQISQTSQPSEDSPLGALGAFSTSSGSARFTKSFVEHGFVIGVFCLRQIHTYQQGIRKMWMRSERMDYYNPLLAHIGEQPVYQSEIYAIGKIDLKDNAFGYQEPFAELRTHPSEVTGELRSNVDNSLDIWHFADDYENAPVLSQAWLEETPAYVDRTLAVPSTMSDQFIIDFYHNISAYRVLPAYGTPGLIDHDTTR